MQKNTTEIWMHTSWLFKDNQCWIENLYKNFLENPHSVDKVWRIAFQNLNNLNINKNNLCYNLDYKKEKVMQLINAFRFYGHKYANTNPIMLWEKKSIDNNFNPILYDLHFTDLKKNFLIENFSDKTNIKNLHEIYTHLKKIYCTTVGSEYMYISNKEQKAWIQKKIESLNTFYCFSNQEKITFVKQLVHAERLEKYLEKKFPGAKRFSLEGADALIPMLKEIISYAGKNKTHKIFLSMAHRGRLNVLINIFGKNISHIFNEFLGKNTFLSGTGDVKYHLGHRADIKVFGKILHLVLTYNPSHLEIVYPVMMGAVRARIDNFKIDKILPIVIHGDVAISAQGVVQETLNFSKVRGYSVGGTVHIIINNQIGFTTSNVQDIRSTKYCTDIGKMIEAPIFHVNGDDIEAVIFITRLALSFRKKFAKDVFIDLICYRRHGHNESDDPSVTQPIMYQKIKKHPSLCKLYSEKLMSEQIINLHDLKTLISHYENHLDSGKNFISELIPVTNINTSLKNKKIKKKLTLEHIIHLKKLAKKINKIPKNIMLHPNVKKIYQNRIDMVYEKKPLDWSTTELLAYASLLYEGISCRLSGQDVGRGTFFQRHAIIYDQKTELTYIPLQNVKKNQGAFNIWNSVLSEEAVLAFEYGYSVFAPNTLTIWEAQFGDFTNNAQVVIDQFLVSGEKKWEQTSNLVMLLPHGYEGQGPEHSSARLERYLQLCAEDNIKICIPSKPSQIYHIIRKQVLKNIKKPLIIFSPKSLLRHPLATSTFKELSYGSFMPIIDETDQLAFNKIKRIILCSGKIYYELITQRKKNEQNNIAIIRIEQMYPFPAEKMKIILKNYKNIQDVVWCQEEPKNQGAWFYIKYYFYKLISDKTSLRYIGRPNSSVTAEGYATLHQKQQNKIIENALYVNE